MGALEGLETTFGDGDVGTLRVPSCENAPGGAGGNTWPAPCERSLDADPPRLVNLSSTSISFKILLTSELGGFLTTGGVTSA